MAINDGGAAFPNSPWAEGLSIRDYFAAKAMAAMISNDVCMTLLFQEINMMTAKGLVLLASQSYDFADAMLAARSREPTP